MTTQIKLDGKVFYETLNLATKFTAKASDNVPVLEAVSLLVGKDEIQLVATDRFKIIIGSVRATDAWYPTFITPLDDEKAIRGLISPKAAKIMLATLRTLGYSKRGNHPLTCEVDEDGNITLSSPLAPAALYESKNVALDQDYPRHIASFFPNWALEEDIDTAKLEAYDISLLGGYKHLHLVVKPGAEDTRTARAVLVNHRTKSPIHAIGLLMHNRDLRRN